MLTCPSPSKRRNHAAQRYQWRIPVAEVYPLLIIVFLSNLIIHHLHLDLILKENEPLTINMQDMDLNHVAMRRHDICQKYTDFQAKSCILKVRDLRHCSLTTCDRSVCSALLQGDGEILSVNDAILYSYKMKRTTALYCDVFVVSNFLDQFMWNISGGPMLNEVLSWSGLIKQYVTGKGLCQILRLLNRSRTKLSLLLKFCCQIWLSEVSLERSFLAICSSDASTLSHRTPQSKVMTKILF